MPIRTGDTAPYAPPATVLQIINGFRDRGLATPITQEVLLRASVPESLLPRTLRSLQVLELIDEEGNPTAALEGLRRATSDEFRQRLEEIVKSVYAEVFQFCDPAKDDATRIADAFRAYEPLGQRGRMVTLFLGLCQAAGIVPEGKKPAPGPSYGPRSPRPAASRGRKDTEERGPTMGPTAHVRGIPPALTGLLAAIPFEHGWTEAQRTKFIQTFQAVLDFTVPTIDADATAKHEGDH